MRGGLPPFLAGPDSSNFMMRSQTREAFAVLVDYRHSLGVSSISAVWRRIFVSILLLGCAACSGATPTSEPTPTPSAEPSATAKPLPSGVQARIETGNTPESTVDAFGSIWVSDHRPGKLTRIDPSNNSVVATVDVGGGHIGPALEAAGKLWTMSADASKVVAIDPLTNTAAGSIDCGCEDEGGLTWVADALWFSAPDGMWWRIDPETLKVTQKGKGTPLAASLVVGDRWFGIDDSRVLYEFDPRSGKTIDTGDLKSELGSGALVAAVDGSTIWLSTNDGTISRYDVTSARASRLVKLDLSEVITDPQAPVLIAATTDAIYLRPAPEVILHVDPRTGEIAQRFEGMPSGEYHSYITVAYGSLWVPHFSNASIWRLALDAI
jgi:hypothetical protein